MSVARAATMSPATELLVVVVVADMSQEMLIYSDAVKLRFLVQYLRSLTTEALPVVLVLCLWLL